MGKLYIVPTPIGNLDDITAAMNEAIESSGFFKAVAGETAKT